MTDDNLHTPEGWYIVKLEAGIERLRGALVSAYDALVNGRPADAKAAMWAALNEPPEEPGAETEEPAS